MLRVLTLACLFMLSWLGLAYPSPSLYQVDMIVFTHLQTPASVVDRSSGPLIAPNTRHAIQLANEVSSAMTPYHALPASLSHLRDEYWALNRKPQYQILFRYTWLQPSNNQQAIALSEVNSGGWNVEGTLSIRQSNYYLLDTALLFSAPNSTQTSFIFSQKQRLKPGVVYYLDHPQAGMLIKIHQIT